MKLNTQILQAIEAVRDIRNIVDPEKYEYSSTQLDLPRGMAREILEYGLHIPESDIKIDEDDFDMGREQNPHITVVYGLTTKDCKKIENAVGDQKPIPIKLGKISFFENEDKDQDVLKIEVDSPELNNLYKKMKGSLSTPGNTFDTYNPHVTIAYLKRGKGKKYYGDTTFSGRTFVASELTFSHNGSFDYICFQ